MQKKNLILISVAYYSTFYTQVLITTCTVTIFVCMESLKKFSYDYICSTTFANRIRCISHVLNRIIENGIALMQVLCLDLTWCCLTSYTYSVVMFHTANTPLIYTRSGAFLSTRALQSLDTFHFN